MKTKVMQVMLALALGSVAIIPASAAEGVTAVAEWNYDSFGFHASEPLGSDRMSPQLNLIYRAPDDRRWNASSHSWEHVAPHEDSLARFAAQLEAIIASAFEARDNGTLNLNIFLVVGGSHWRLRDCNWDDLCLPDLCSPNEPTGPNLPEPATVTAVLGLAVGATAFLRRRAQRLRIS